MKHFSEEELIAYQLGESGDAEAIRAHVEVCTTCSALADSLAETLRVFSAEPVPAVEFERSWERVRGHLTVLEPEPRRFGWLRSPWAWSAAGVAMAAVLVLAVSLKVHVLRDFGAGAHYAMQRPGSGRVPFTEQPMGQPTNPAIAEHLDAAERLLTEVNHSSGPLDAVTRSQARALLVKNAVYVSSAHAQGDVAEATVLENLGRVLTTIDNVSDRQGQREARALDEAEGVGFRLEMNTSGLLLEIRILRQNDDRKQ